MYTYMHGLIVLYIHAYIYNLIETTYKIQTIFYPVFTSMDMVREWSDKEINQNTFCGWLRDRIPSSSAE